MKAKAQNQWWKKWAVWLTVLLFSSTIYAGNAQEIDSIAVANLPLAAQQTLQLIKRGGPFPYAKDGSVFGNYEGLLPKEKRGYYHEFTVKASAYRGRGAKRIIVGGSPAAAVDYYYTADHYQTFKRIRE